mmetsp:Transcript_21417/g.45084  ORF Transcript_21417/g.45084 Transcript_21417/m.45084 type:complete len:573 (-) Transcript_21417:2533-4251(-)
MVLHRCMRPMTFSLPALILIAIGIVVAIGDKNVKVYAFTGTSEIATQCQHQRERRSVHSASISSGTFFPTIPIRDIRQSSLSARIYGADGTVMNDDEFENKDVAAVNQYYSPSGSSTIEKSSVSFPSTILETLKDAVGDQSVWTRIACAFALPPHNQLIPELVQNAQLVRVGGTSIDVALVVPASSGPTASPTADQLAQVLVTVGFPQSWATEENEGNDDETLNMLVQQIRVLDGHANDRLSQRSASAIAARDDPHYYERIVIEKRWMERLQEEADQSDSLPHWWTTIAPQSSPLELVDECKLLKELLNEDEFEDELRALFVKHYDDKNANIDNLAAAPAPAVLRVAVASIGSSGLYLKARVVATNDDDDPCENLSAAVVPYEEDISDKKVQTSGELRESVLVLVESVAPMPMPPTAKAMSETVTGQLSGISTSPAANDNENFTPFNEQVVAVVTNLEENAKPKPSTSNSDSEASIARPEEEYDTIIKVEASSYKTRAATGAPPQEKKMDKSLVEEVEEAHKEMASMPSTKSKRTYYQRKSSEEEAERSAEYAAIDDLGERAYAILRDLNMI